MKELWTVHAEVTTLSIAIQWDSVWVSLFIVCLLDIWQAMINAHIETDQMSQLDLQHVYFLFESYGAQISPQGSLGWECFWYSSVIPDVVIIPYF